jgi:hypothetical protein
MAVLYVAEFQFMGQVPSASGQMAQQAPLAEQTASIGGSSATLTNPFNAKTAFIRVHTDAICSIKVGASPTATTSTARMAANQTEYFGVPVGAGWNIAVISNS